MQNRLRHSGLGLGSALTMISGSSSSTPQWSDAEYILSDGAIWYKREINNTEGYFKLWYSDNAGATYEELLSYDLTEDFPVIDLAHAYTHQINGTSYEVLDGEDILYST